MNEECIKTLHMDRAGNPWAGLTANFKEEEASKTIKPYSLNADEFIFFPHLDKYRINNKPLIAKYKEKKIIAVEKDFFSELKKADATIMKKDTTQIIGKINVDILKLIDSRTLAFFLIESQIITTYWHLESNLCMEKEENLDTQYKSFFRGSHIYYTNKKNVKSLYFYLIINKKTGEMSIAF